MTRTVRVAEVDASGRVGEDAGRDVDPEAAEPDGLPPGHGFRQPLVTPLGRRSDGRWTLEVVVDGWRFELIVEETARAVLRRRASRDEDAGTTSGPAEIRAIIPGRVAAVRVAAGDSVDAGATLLVVEAMKMQNELRAPRAGTVTRVAVGEGQTIDAGDLLVVLT
jgi:biotin carboxyl carrier protein